MGKITTKQVFKQYSQEQIFLFPPSLEELIPGEHLVRVVNQIVEQMDLTAIYNSYKGGGTSAYHPKMLVKVLLYAYAMKIYTGRKIAKALREDVNFMWLATMSRPDFRTINGFRSGVLKGTIEDLFKSMLSFLVAHEYINFENYFCDGSTFGANANRYKMVWKKNAERYQAATEEKCKQLFEQIDLLNQREDKQHGDKDLAETGRQGINVDDKSIQQQVEKLNHIIKNTSIKKDKRKAESLKKKLAEHTAKIARYEHQKQISRNRSGYSITDTDATAMMMKNQEILPAYNIMIGSENQYILNYTVHQNANDGVCFKEHINQLEKHTDLSPGYIIADSIFGTQENYQLLEEKKIGNLMKFPLYQKEQSNKYKNNPYNRDNFPYDQNSDTYLCPNQKPLYFSHIKKDKNKNGFQMQSRVYECEDCAGCPFATACKKSAEQNRTITINIQYEYYKQQARQNLRTEKGAALKRRRGCEVETCFGDIKMNQNFKRFYLRGKQKIAVEFGIIAMAHNLRKIHLQLLGKHQNAA
jgi:transposase